MYIVIVPLEKAFLGQEIGQLKVSVFSWRTQEIFFKTNRTLFPQIKFTVGNFV